MAIYNKDVGPSQKKQKTLFSFPPGFIIIYSLSRSVYIPVFLFLFKHLRLSTSYRFNPIFLLLWVRFFIFFKPTTTLVDEKKIPAGIWTLKAREGGELK